MPTAIVGVGKIGSTLARRLVCGGQPVALATRRGISAVRRQVAFWLLAFVFAAAVLGTTLLTLLYVIHQDQWHFSAAIAGSPRGVEP